MESNGNIQIGGELLESLIVLCRYHQIEANPDYLINGLPLNNGSLTPSVFFRAAKRANLNSKIIKKDIKNINKALLPAILILNDEKSCVLKSIDGNICKAVFPEIPDSEIKISLKVLSENYSGYVIYARPSPLRIQENSFFSDTEKGHWFWSIIRLNKPLYSDIIASAIVVNLMAIAMPMFVMNIYDRVVPNNAFSTLWVLAIGMILLISSDLILKLLRTWFVDLAANRSDIQISSTLMSHSLAISLDKKPSSNGALISAVQSFEAVRSFISSLTITALADLPFLLLFITIIALINVNLAIPIILGSTLILLYALISQQNMRTLAKNSMEFGTERTNLLIESLSDLETIKSFNLQNKVQSKWERLTLFLSTNSSKMRFLSATVSQGSAWIQQITGISIIIIGVYQISSGNLTQGGLIAAYLLSTRALMPVSQCAALISQFHQASTAMDTLEKTMQIPKESNPNDIKINKSKIDGNITFNNVCFSYKDSEIQALSKINFTIKKGEHVAIIGKNGSGKSTIEKLITGLHQPTEGKILIDGINIKQIEKSKLRRQIGYVPQDITLLNGSLKSNIVSSTQDISDDLIISISDQLGLGPLISSNPKGILLPTGERGSNLSIGQKQSVAIARAIIHGPSLFILDEPTSALDNVCEEKVTRFLHEFTKGKTLILITHRSPLLRLVNRIIILDQGCIVADGPKEEILNALSQGTIRGAS